MPLRVRLSEGLGPGLCITDAKLTIDRKPCALPSVSSFGLRAAQLRGQCSPSRRGYRRNKGVFLLSVSTFANAHRR